jgi:hypothetical protein
MKSERRKHEEREAKTIRAFGERGAPPPKEVDKGECEHGVRPWWNCEACSKTKTYSFRGNFR